MNPRELAPRVVDAGASGLGTDLPWEVRADVVLMQERTRTGFAYLLLALLFTIVLTAFLAYGTKWGDLQGMSDFLERVFTPIVGLLGTVVGFYYGQQTQSGSQ
jgi:hypothetical protein